MYERRTGHAKCMNAEGIHVNTLHDQIGGIHVNMLHDQIGVHTSINSKQK